MIPAIIMTSSAEKPLQKTRFQLLPLVLSHFCVIARFNGREHGIAATCADAIAFINESLIDAANQFLRRLISHWQVQAAGAL
jgi:hypothetical protein